MIPFAVTLRGFESSGLGGATLSLPFGEKLLQFHPGPARNGKTCELMMLYGTRLTELRS